MVNVKNNHHSALGLPRQVAIIPAGATVAVKDWAKIKDHDVVKAWLRANAIEVVGGDDASDELRQDGPTVGEYVAAGYLARNYPPAGYASRSTDEEIALAIAAEKSDKQAATTEPADDLEARLRSMKNAELAAYIEARGGDVKSGATKDDLVAQALELPVDAQ